MNLPRHLCPAALVVLCLLASPARAENAATAKARQLYQEAQKQFDLGNWNAAAEGFSKAYELRPDPTFLYNMAQAYRRGGNAKRAIDLYKNYLIKDPKSPQRAEVEERIRSLQKQLEEEEAKRTAGVQTGPDGQASAEPGAVPAAGVPSPAATTSPAAATPAATVAPPAIATPPAVGPAPEPAPSGAVAPPPATGAVAPPPATTESAPAPDGTAAAAAASPFAGDANPATAPEVGAVSVPDVGAASTATPVAEAPASSQPVAKAAAMPAESSGGSRGLRIAGVVVGGAGVISAGLGAFLSYRTHSLSNSVSNAKQFNYADAQTGKRAEMAQWICYGAAAALLATGAVLYWRGRASKGHEVRVGLAPMLAETGAGLAAAGSFR